MNAKINDFIFITTLISLVIVYFSFSPLNSDSVWILYSANEILNNATLYIDLFEVNPPLIIIYSILPVLFAKFISISFASSYIFFVLIFISLSIILSWNILRKYYVGKENELRYYLYFIGFILTVSVSSNFGQREHLFMIFLLPYILMMLYRDKINLSFLNIVFIAVFASLGFNIKPHFFIIFISIELVYMLHRKNILSILRVDSFIIIISGFLYLLLIFIEFPQYIDFILPMATEAYIPVFNKSYETLLLNYEILLLISSILFWFFFGGKKLDFSMKILFCIMMTSLLIYLLQQKGWSYHRIPLLISILLFLTYILINNLKKDSKIYFFGFLPIIISIMINNIQTVPTFFELQNILKNLPAKSKIHILSTDGARGQALLVKDQKWASRFGSLLILPSVLNQNNESVKIYLFNSLYEDLKKYKPDTIIFCGKYSSFDYYKYFSQNLQLKEIYDTHYTKSIVDGYTILSKRKNINFNADL